MPSYSSSQAVLAGPAQTFSPTGFTAGYFEVHNLGGVTYTVTFQSATYPLPAGGRLAFQITLPTTGTPSNGISVSGTGTVFVFFASSAPPAPILTANALGGGSGGIYTVDNVTLQEAVANQFSIKPLGVGTAQLAADAVNEEKVAVNALQGWHVGGAINVSPPEGQLHVIAWAGNPTPGDTFELTASYGLAGTTVSQEWIFDAAPGPGQIAITSTGNPVADMSTAISAWAAGTFPVTTKVSCDQVGSILLWLGFIDLASISVTSSGMQWSGATPTNCTVQLAPATSNMLPTPQPLRVVTRQITTVEAAQELCLVLPASQGIYTTPPLVQVWRLVAPDQWIPSPDALLSISAVGADGERWIIQSTNFDVADVVTYCFGAPVNPAITPNPYP